MPTRPCWVEISTPSLEENYRVLERLAAPHAELLPIVKANSYGHSLALCAPAVVRAGARWLGITSVEEGVAARALCPQPRIVAIAGIFPGQGPAAIEHRLTAVVWEPWQLDELEGAARAAGLQPGSLPIHLEIDTGMSRQGVGPETLATILARLHPASPLKLEGVMTHLYAADEADGQVTREQLARLGTALHRIEAAGLYADWLHVGNSAALLAGQARAIGELAAHHGMKALLRPGLSLYGLVPDFEPGFKPGSDPGSDPGPDPGFELGFSAQEPPTLTAARTALRPVLTWKTRVVGVRTVPAGASVGYQGSFVAARTSRLALVAAGYADGLDRRLGNRFSLLVRGRRAPLAGRISMDQSVLDVTDIPGVAAGDEVVILGTQGAESITAFDHAEAGGTIPWEVFTRIGARVQRVAV